MYCLEGCRVVPAGSACGDLTTETSPRLMHRNRAHCTTVTWLQLLRPLLQHLAPLWQHTLPHAQLPCHWPCAALRPLRVPVRFAAPCVLALPLPVVPEACHQIRRTSKHLPYISHAFGRVTDAWACQIKLCILLPT